MMTSPGIGRACMVCAVLVIALSLPPISTQGQTTHDMQMSQVSKSGLGDSKIDVAVLLYDGVLLLDYGIAAEMFLAADFMRKFDVYTVGHDPSVNLSIVDAVRTDYTFDNAPPPDVIIVPGGPMWGQEGDNAEIRPSSSVRWPTVAFCIRSAPARWFLARRVCSMDTR